MNAEIGFRPWFEKYPELYKAQTDILKSAGFILDEEVLKKFGRVEFLGRSKVEPDRQLRVVFPTAFPSSSPQIFDLPPSKLLSRHHLAHNRQLCIFGFGGSRWSATLTAADALKEADDLITEFKNGSAFDLTAQPPEPVSHGLQYIPQSVILVPPPISTFKDFAKLNLSTGWFLGRFVNQGDFQKGTNGRGIIYKAQFGNYELNCDKPFSGYPENAGKQINGKWFYLQNSPSIEELSEALKACFLKCKSVSQSAFYWFAMIFPEESAKVGQTRLTWLIVRANAAGEFHRILTLPYVQSERYARIPGLEGLEEKTVTILGCGSLGSKIASNLAATGVNRFHLIDHDYFEPGNTVRHELGVESFGLPKALALLSRLSSLNPLVATNSDHFLFQAASIAPLEHEKTFFGFVKQSDLIIDATGFHFASHFVNELSFELNVPALYASVTNGAWGGEVVRAVPSKTPCWLCWVDQYYEITPPSAPNSIAEIFAPGCDQPTFTGTTYDLGFVASLATSMAVETLLSGKMQPDFERNYIRWSGKDENGKQLFLTEILSTTTRQGCELCGR